MTREEFLNKTILEQIKHYNKMLKNGMSITAISKDIGISKSITEKFKKKGYVFQDNQLTLIDGKTEPIIVLEKESNPKKTTLKDTSTNKGIVPERKPKKGRPPKATLTTKHTISMNDEVWTKLRVFSIINKIDVSEILEKLTIEFLNKNGA